MISSAVLLAAVCHEHVWQWVADEDAAYWRQVTEGIQTAALAFAMHCGWRHCVTTAAAVLAAGYGSTTAVCAYAWLQIRWPLTNESMCTQWLGAPVMLASAAAALFAGAVVWRYTKTSTNPPGA